VALDVLADDDFGQFGDYFPDNLLDDFAREPGDGLVLGAAGADGGDLLVDGGADRG
jgi:hypothetical protein